LSKSVSIIQLKFGTLETLFGVFGGSRFLG